MCEVKVESRTRVEEHGRTVLYEKIYRGVPTQGGRLRLLAYYERRIPLAHMQMELRAVGHEKRMEGSGVSRPNGRQGTDIVPCPLLSGNKGGYNMSIKSQEGHMRQLALLLTADLGCIFGERESGPNGSKKAFLNVGKVFLRALAKDLGLHEVTVSANSGGIAVSGTCSLYGMWEDSGIAVWIEQRLCADGKVLCYRMIRSSRDFKGGYNHFLTSSDLKTWSYPQLLETLSALRKDGCRYERAA